jgi:hypothetical protein
MMLLCCHKNGLPKTGLGTLCTQIAATTLQFGKPYEELDFRRLSQGKPSLFQAGTHKSTRQISRDMKILCASGLVHRLVRSGKSNLYALAPERIVAFIKKMLAECKADESSYARYLHNMWTKKVAPYLHVLEKLGQKILAFAQVTGRNSKEIIAGIRTTAAQFMAVARKTVTATTQKVTEKVEAVVNGFYGSVINATPSKDEPTATKRNKFRTEPLFSKAGKPNGRGGLAWWEKLAQDHVSEHFVEKVTGKTIGQMKKYLTELRADGDRTDEQIVEHITTLMKCWQRPMGHGRDYNVPSKFGGTRTVQLIMYPDFDVFFNDRFPITRLLFATAVASEVQNTGGTEYRGVPLQDF